MKQTKKPTREQRKHIERAGLDTYTTRVIKETAYTLEVINADGKVMTISKEENK